MWIFCLFACLLPSCSYQYKVVVLVGCNAEKELIWFVLHSPVSVYLLKFYQCIHSKIETEIKYVTLNLCENTRGS